MTELRYSYSHEDRLLAEWGEHYAPRRLHECIDCQGESHDGERCEACYRELGAGE